MEKDFTKIVTEKINRLAREYQKKGFQVIVEPKGNNLPQFLKDFTPDIIVKGPKKNIVIEVTTWLSIKNSIKLKSLSEIIEKQKGWNLELVIIRPQKEIKGVKEKVEKSIEFSLSILKKNLEIAEKVSNLDLKSGLLSTWSVFEAASRNLLEIEQPEIQPVKNPLGMVKQLFTYGIINLF